MSILIFMVNISWGRWFVKSSLPWLIRFNAISPGFYFYFFFFFFYFFPPNEPRDQPIPPQHTTLLRGPTPLSGTNGTYKIALDRSNEFPPTSPRGEKEEEEGDDNVAGLFIRSICPFRRALNCSMANSRTKQRDREMDSRHFGPGIQIDEGRERRHREDRACRRRGEYHYLGA